MSGLNAASKRFLQAAFPNGGAWLVRAHYDAQDQLVILEEGPAGTFDLPDGDDLYYCVGQTGTGRTAIERVRVLVIDDVGKEISREDFEMLCPLEPSFWRESSSGSFQVGFIIKDGESPEDFKARRQAMRAHPVWGKAHNIGAAAIYRLPQGTHTKSSRMGWKVRDESWAGLSYTPGELDALIPAGVAKVAPAAKRFEWTLGDEALEALVDLIPNDLDRRDWIGVAHGIAGAGGEFEIFEKFCNRWTGVVDDAETARAWGSLPESMSGGGLLRRLAETADADGFAAWKSKWETPEVFAGEAPEIPPDFTGDGGALEPMQRSVADSIVRSHGEALRFNHDSGCWHRFGSWGWEPLPKSIKAGFVLAERWAARNSHALGKADLKAVNKANFYDGVESILRQRLVIRQGDFDQDGWLLGTPGGTVDLRTGALRAALPGDFISRCTRVAPASREDCPRWLKFIGEITKGDLASATFLRQWAGYNLTGDTSEEVFLFLYGPGGNGKSKFVDTLAWVLGTYFVKPVSDLYIKKAHTRHMQEVAMLAGARMVTMSEVPAGASWDERALKDHTGGGAVTANFMRENSFSFTPLFKLTAYGNHQPTFPGGMDPAIRRRFRMMLFDFVPKVVDGTLEQVLRAEGAGILRWALNGLCDSQTGWHRTRLIIPPAVEAVTDEYAAEQDILAGWIADRTEKKTGALTASEPLYRDWIEYRNSQGEVTELYSSVHSLVKELERRGWVRARTNAFKGFRDKVLKAKVNSRFDED